MSSLRRVWLLTLGYRERISEICWQYARYDARAGVFTAYRCNNNSALSQRRARRGFTWGSRHTS